MYSLWDSQCHSSFFQTLFFCPLSISASFYDDTKFSLVDLLLRCLSIMLSGFFPPQKLFCCACHLWIYFFYHIHTYFQLCADANGGISSVFHTFHGFPGVTWEVLCFLEPRSFHGCALCRGRVFSQLEHLRAAGRLHETQAACGAFTYPSSFTVVMQSSPFKAFTHQLLLAVNASAEMFVPYF